MIVMSAETIKHADFPFYYDLIIGEKSTLM